MKTVANKNKTGFTLLETMISMSVLFIAMTGLISVVVSSTQLRKQNEEKALARNAANQAFSAIRGMPDIADAYNRFGGGGPEETFNVHGLQGPSANEPAGRIIVWRRKSSLKNRLNPPQPDPGSAMVLIQDDIRAAQASFSSSFPNVMDTMAEAAGTGWDDYIDTNGNSIVEATDEPQLMPVTVRIRWMGSSGVITQYYSAVIGRR